MINTYILHVPHTPKMTGLQQDIVRMFTSKFEAHYLCTVTYLWLNLKFFQNRFLTFYHVLLQVLSPSYSHTTASIPIDPISLARLQ